MAVDEFHKQTIINKFEVNKMATMSEINVRNPLTGKYDYTFVPTSKEELANKVKKLRANQKSWSEKTLDEKIKILKKWEQKLKNNEKEIMNALIADTGRVNESIREFNNISSWIDRWSKLARETLGEPDTVDSNYFPAYEMKQQLVPYELVGIISPWNFPMSLSAMDMIPALLAGSAVIVKPSEVTPRFIKPLQKSIEEVPELAAVLQYIEGDGVIGSELVESSDVIVFTGSERTGKKIASQAGANLTPVFLELGGKDPAIVTNTANIGKAAKAILFGSVNGVGHQCFSTERIYVDKKVHDDFIKQLTKEAAKLKVSYELGKGEIGPIIFKEQINIIQEHIDDALSKGANIECGGTIENKNESYWLKPTVITGVDHSMKIMQEETFGPIMPIMSFETVDEAISLANDTRYGLSASVFAGTKEEAYPVAKQINAGGISINDAGVLPFMILEAPDYSAYGVSGMGESRFGKRGLMRYFHKKLLINKTSDESSPWWY